jgi:hypothetical protein
VAGVLAFSVSARTREFGIRLAIGSAPKDLLGRVLREGAVIAFAGSPQGDWRPGARACAGSFIEGIKMPGALPLGAAAVVLFAAAVAASLMPRRAAQRVDVSRRCARD